MAIDEALLLALVEGQSPPTLRFFQWAPPCLSLGRNQPAADAHLEACRAAGVEIVRRPTGGRAILHTDELTYSLVVPQTDPRAEGGIVASYRRLSEGLLLGLRALGADVVQAAAARPGPGEPSAVCFQTPSDYEIISGGRKLVGSAQWRSRGGVLQHGSLPLTGDLARIVGYLSLSQEQQAAERCALSARALTLEEALGRVVSFDVAVRALAGGLAQALNLALVPGDLTDAERARAGELSHSRYARLDWPAHS